MPNTVETLFDFPTSLHVAPGESRRQCELLNQRGWEKVLHP